MSSPSPCAAELALAPGQRADLYQALAEALAEPPAWLAEAGLDWPLMEPARALVAAGHAPAELEAALAALSAEPPATRQARYAALFGGAGGRPQIWLYESAVRGGRPFGPEMTAVARLYRAAGVMPASAELSDHAALELSFLAYLAASQSGPAGAAWAEWERRFLADHAGRWLPQLGQALADSGDPVYAGIGQVLRAAFQPAAARRGLAAGRRQPVLAVPAACSLCGFCARVCPTHALVVQESPQETWLALTPAACTGCGKCVRICAEHVLQLAAGADAAVVLRQSPRLTCPGCGRPAVSEAEFENVAAKIGRPAWLAYCPDCRTQQLAPRPLPQENQA